jgi:hypothetical protein
MPFSGQSEISCGIQQCGSREKTRAKLEKAATRSISCHLEPQSPDWPSYPANIMGGD